MPAARLVIGVAATILAPFGCAPRVAEISPTPSATLQAGASGLSRAQAVWVGDWILTAAHVLVGDHENPTLLPEGLLDGEPVQIVDAVSGDLQALAQSGPAKWTEDWVVAQVSNSAPSPIPLRLCHRPVKPGVRLFAAGFPPDETRPRLETFPLVVLDWDNETDDDEMGAALQRIILVSGPQEALYGWSGAFVGRYDARSRDLRFVGLLIGGVEDEDGEMIHIVVRPPLEALKKVIGHPHTP